MMSDDEHYNYNQNDKRERRREGRGRGGSEGGGGGGWIGREKKRYGRKLRKEERRKSLNRMELQSCTETTNTLATVWSDQGIGE